MLFGFQLERINYLYAGGSGLYVHLSTSLWMIDLAGGGYASLFLDRGKNVRVYVGAGPLMTYASYRADKEFSDGSPDVKSNENAFGLGVYARTGFEFRVAEMGLLGLGVRGTWSDIDFSSIGGRSELVGIAAFATFTAGF